MAWLRKVSLGDFPDLAGAVTKLSESVKNIEKNFDSALGLEEKPADASEASGLWPLASDGTALFDPVRAFIGNKRNDGSVEALEKTESSEHSFPSKGHEKSSVQDPFASSPEVIGTDGNEREYEGKGKVNEDVLSDLASVSKGEGVGSNIEDKPHRDAAKADESKIEAEQEISQYEMDMPNSGILESEKNVLSSQQEEVKRDETNQELEPGTAEATLSDGLPQTNVFDTYDAVHHSSDEQENKEIKETSTEVQHEASLQLLDAFDNKQLQFVPEPSVGTPVPRNESGPGNSELEHAELPHSSNDGEVPSDSVGVIALEEPSEIATFKQSVTKIGDDKASAVSVAEVEKITKEMKQMEAALQGAARQAQAKADEIANLMSENEQLKATVEDLKKRFSEAELDALRDEYHQKVASLERKVYALTKERDMLRREQSKRSDAAALLKEKDEIISQVMAEGEQLSKKQAAQEATMRKLRAQIRELEEEKERLNAKLQVEESKVESIKRDKAETEKLLRDTIEKNQTELAAQKEFYTKALDAAKEAEALAEARTNNEARVELESRLKEASEREAMLVQELDELRLTLSRMEQQAAFKEEMLQRDIDDLKKRCQASELRCNELITQVPESTRPLLRQIEAIQETAARRTEAWAGVERSLNSRLQEAEAKAAAAEEKERSITERLSQAVSRITVLETQISCLRTEQTQLNRTLEKERQRAAENRHEYLAAVEEAATQEGRAKQLEDELRELRVKHKQELHEAAARRELLEKELEIEKSSRSELEKTSRETLAAVNPSPIIKFNSSHLENVAGNGLIRKLSSAGSLSSIEESALLQASLDSSDGVFSERRGPGEATISTYFLKSMTPSAFEAALRQKDGELASYVSRLASLESIRDSLAEELVKMTEQCEKLRAEAALLPGLRAELEALRRRHSAALELMGERDEELEELRADIIDLKEMYREQVDLLVNRIQILSASVGAA